MLDENLIATLEQSLRQTRNAQQRLISRLNEVEAEANRLRQEIDALGNSANKTEQAIDSLLENIRSGSNNWKLSKNFRVDDYDLPQDLQRAPRGPQSQYDNYDNYDSYDSYGSQNHQIPNNQPQQHNAPPPNGYRNNTVPFIPNQRMPVAPSIEPISHRFADRTITQACTLLLREYQRPLHVSELYNLLVAGGMEFKGENPTISIAVSLNRNRRFRKVSPGTFDLHMRDASQAAS